MEFEKRERAKQSLLTYASIIEIPGSPVVTEEDEKEQFKPIVGSFGKHHLLWLDCLQQVEDGKIKRLMGLMPPGSGKSIFSSIVFPTHFMGRFPGKAVIIASYGTDLPRKFGRRARSIVKQPMYQRIFGTELSAESSAVDEWALTSGSEFMAAGILSGITGNRVDGIVWDDLIKGREAADSKVQRDKTWDAYLDDLKTRKKPNAWEIGVNTRWHEDDPSGRILPPNYHGESGWLRGQDGNDWYVVCIPAIAERDDDILGRKPGDRLWPEWFPEDHFDQFKGSSRTWNALFQQRPAPDSGDFFKAEWLKPYYVAPHRDTMHIYGASDYATTSDGGDYTVHLVVGVDPEGDIYVLDYWRQQASSDQWVTAMCDLVKKWRPMGWAEETGQIRAGVGPFITKSLADRNLYIARTTFPTRGDKSIRAQSIRGRMAMRGLHYPQAAPWFPDFKGELMSFPAGKYDDQVDALGLIGQILDKMIGGHPLEPTDRRDKVVSTDINLCTVTLNDLFEANESKLGYKSYRIN